MVLTGRIEGKRSRGRRRTLWRRSLQEWLGERGVDHQAGEFKYTEPKTESCGAPGLPIRLKIGNLDR